MGQSTLKGAGDKLVSELVQTASKCVHRRTKEEVSRSAAVSKEDTENLQKVGLSASHRVLCAENDEFCMIDSSNSV